MALGGAGVVPLDAVRPEAVLDSKRVKRLAIRWLSLKRRGDGRCATG